MALITRFLAALVLFSSCTNSQENGRYPQIVDSLQLQTQYDKTKWHLYLLHCDDTPKNINGTYLFKDAKPFSAYELRFDSLVCHDDTTEYYFDFYLNDTLAINCVNFRNMKNDLDNGLIFVNGIDSPLCYTFNCKDATKSICLTESPAYFDTTTNRFAKPLQPDVVAFLNKNRQSLHPWLYSESVRRGVVK